MKKTIIKRLLTFFVAFLVFFGAFATSVLACTSVLVGKDASVDGSVIVARNEDAYSAWSKHFVVHPRTTNEPGAKFHSDGTGFEFPLPDVSFKYTATPDWDPSEGLYEEAGINEYQVAVSATETADYNDKAAEADPLVDDGIAEDSVTTVVLPRVKNAREGVALVGKIVEIFGSAEVFGMAIADPSEVWYLEVGSGHHWVAARVPDDSYMVVANQLRIGEVNLEDTDNFMGSDDLITFAQAHGLYNPAVDGAFNFAKAYGTDKPSDYSSNYPRVWWGETLLSPSLDLQPGLNNYPVFAQPDEKIAVEDVMSVLRSHYDGSEFDTRSENPVQKLRPITVNSTMESHVIQLRSDMPAPISGIQWVAMGVTETSVYVPFYSGITDTPAAYQKGTDEYDTESAYWAFRSVNNIVNSNYAEYAPIVKDTWKAFEAKTLKQTAVVDKIAKILYEKDPEKCAEFLTKYSNRVAEKAIKQARVLEKQLGEE